MPANSTPVDELAADCRAKRERAELVRTRLRLGEATYEQAATAARDFCAAFDRYHRARFGKPKQLDYRAFLR